MGKQISVTKFRGLVTNPNALTTADGAMEQASNITLSQPDLIAKRRGFRSTCKMVPGYISFGLYQFGGNFFEGHAIFSGSTSTFGVAIVSPVELGLKALNAFNFPLGLPAFGWRPYVTVETFTANDTWKVSAKNTLRQLDAGGNMAWTEFAAIPSPGSPTCVVNILWPYSATAIGKYNTTAGGTFGMIPFGARAHVLFNTVNPLRSIILVHDQFVGPTSQSALVSGVAEAMDCDAIPGPDALSDRYTGPINPNCQVSYRVVFLKRYADGTEVFGAPSPICTVVNSKRPCTSVSDQGTEWRFNAPVNDLKGNTFTGNEQVYLYDLVGTGTPPENGSVFNITTNSTGSYFQILQTDMPGFTPTSCSWSTRATGYVNSTVPVSPAITLYARLYRTTSSLDETTSPIARFFFVAETAVDLNTPYVSFVDSMSDSVLQFQEELYTNEDTQEGEAQAAHKYPDTVDSIATYKNCVFLANPQDKIYSSATLVQDPSYSTPLSFTLTVNGVPINYTGAIESDGSTGNAQHIWVITGIAGSTVTLTATGQPYPLGAAGNSGIVLGDTVEVYANNAGITPRRYTVSAVGATTVSLANVQGTPVLNRRLSVAKYAEGKFTQYSADTYAVAGDYWRYGISFAIQKTAEMIAKAVNRKQYAVTCAQATGNLAGTVGALSFPLRDYYGILDGMPGTISGSSKLYPENPTLVTPQRKATLAVSKQGEPESFPLLNRLNVGSQAERIIGLGTTRDSLIVVKADGIFRVNGDNPQNFVSAAIDTTVICVSDGSIAALNNSIYLLSNQGVVQVSDTGVRIVSMAIENLLMPIIGNSVLMALTHAYSSEADRTYFLSTFSPDGNRVTYAYNYMTDTWTTSDESFFSGLSLPTGETYLLSTDQLTFRKQLRDHLPSDYAQSPGGCCLWTGVLALGTNVAGQKQASVTFLQAHGLKSGDVVVCSAYLSACTNRIAAASLAVTVNLTVTSVTSPTVAVLDTTNLQSVAPVGADAVSLVLRSSDTTKVVLGLNAAADAAVVLDAISDDPLASVFYIPVVTAGAASAATYTPDSATWRLQQVTLRDSIAVIAKQGTLWRRIVSDVVMSPLDQSSEDTLKQYSTSQVHFRNDKSCSRMKIGFSNDFTNATAQTSWVAPGFTGPTSSRKYISGRQNVLRTYVPLDCSVGTWIQPRLNHEVACEPWEVQIVSVQVESETDVTTRGKA